MNNQNFKLELFGGDAKKAKIAVEKVFPMILDTVAKLGMVSLEQFAENEELFINTLRVGFVKMFPEYPEVISSGIYHPGDGERSPRYDLGLSLGIGDDGMYPIRLEYLVTATTKRTLH